MKLNKRGRPKKIIHEIIAEETKHEIISDPVVVEPSVDIQI